MTFKTASKNTTTEARTENDMKTLASSLNACVDLFFQIGAKRGQDITALFERAYQEDAILASKILLWSRDIRGGAGERQLFRDMLQHIEVNHPEHLEVILKITPEIGRWDDLLVLKTAKGRTMAFDIIGTALRDSNAMCAKWMPRKGNTAIALRTFLKFTPKQYRKTLVNLTKVVETQMCAKEWNDINFSHVPSVASARYQTAFHRNAPVAYQLYKDALVKNDGTAKVNAGAVYPYDVLKPITDGYGNDALANSEVIKAQWEALPNYLGEDAILPMVDVSGSMFTHVGGSESLTCLSVAISLGLYLADKNTGAFKDMFLTFSERSKIEVLGGDIIAKTQQLMKADWGMNTNLHAAFDQILEVAVQNKVSEENMPKYLLILSDMEFDHCVHFDDSAFQMINRKYEDAGYTVPNIVFWNISSRSESNSPVRFDQHGTALISGFSPAIMQSILAADQITPESIMLDTISIPRYDVFG